MKIEYIPSDSREVQGNWAEIRKKYGREWNIRAMGKGNGTWLLTKKSDVLINGKSYRSFVLARYGRSKLTEKLYYQFRADVESGKVELP